MPPVISQTSMKNPRSDDREREVDARERLDEHPSSDHPSDQMDEGDAQGSQRGGDPAGRSLSRKASTSAVVNLPALRIRSANRRITTRRDAPAAASPMKPPRP